MSVLQPLVILDLNGTLLDSTHHSRHTTQPPDARARSKSVYFRPDLRAFLEWLFSVARVAVWSSNERANVQALVELAFTPAQREQLVFVWDRLYCEPGAGRYETLKPLDRVRHWFDINSSAVRPMVLLIVDDSTHKILASDRAHHVLVPPFTASDSTRFADRGLAWLRSELTRRLRLDPAAQ